MQLVLGDGGDDRSQYATASLALASGCISCSARRGHTPIPVRLFLPGPRRPPLLHVSAHSSPLLCVRVAAGEACRLQTPDGACVHSTCSPVRLWTVCAERRSMLYNYSSSFPCTVRYTEFCSCTVVLRSVKQKGTIQMLSYPNPSLSELKCVDTSLSIDGRKTLTMRCYCYRPTICILTANLVSVNK